MIDLRFTLNKRGQIRYSLDGAETWGTLSGWKCRFDEATYGWFVENRWKKIKTRPMGQHEAFKLALFLATGMDYRDHVTTYDRGVWII